MAMSNEARDRTPFRIEIKPMVEGADPYIESKLRPDRSTNHRAVLQERIRLFDGQPYGVRLGAVPIQARSFVDIRLAYFTDGDRVYHPSAHWGLQNASTGDDIAGYTDAGVDADPIYVFRTARILEALPQLSTDSDQQIEDYCSAASAAARTYYSWDFTEPYRQEMIDRRAKIATAIGRSRWRGIIQELPPNLEEMMQTMEDKGVGVMTQTLERELRIKSLAPSEFYVDKIRAHNQYVDDLARGLEEADGAW